MEQKHCYYRKEKSRLIMTWKKIVSDNWHGFSFCFLCLALCCHFDSVKQGFLYGKEL